MMRFSLKAAMFVITLVATLLGWAIDRRQLTSEISRLHAEQAAKLSRVKLEQEANAYFLHITVTEFDDLLDHLSRVRDSLHQRGLKIETGGKVVEDDHPWQDYVR